MIIHLPAEGMDGRKGAVTIEEIRRERLLGALSCENLVGEMLHQPQGSASVPTGGKRRPW